MTILERYIGKLYLDYAFAILLILQFFLSTTLNPLVILMKMRDKSFTSKMFIFLAFLCFTANIYRAPKIAYIHFQQKNCVDETLNITLYIETVHFCFVTSAAKFILLIIPVTRFIKTIRPFQVISKKRVFIFGLLYMVAMLIAQMFIVFGWSFSNSGWSFLCTIQLAITKEMGKCITYLNIGMLLVSEWAALFFTFATIYVIATSTSMTATRRNKLKALRAVVVMTTFDAASTLTYTIRTYYLTDINIEHTTATTILVYITKVILPSLAAAINPAFILYFGYTKNDVKKLFSGLKHGTP